MVPQDYLFFGWPYYCLLIDPANPQKFTQRPTITPGSGHRARPESQPADWPRSNAPVVKIKGSWNPQIPSGKQT